MVVRLKGKGKGFEYLEHTADAYVASYGETLEEALENAGKALFNLMTDLDKVEPRLEDHVEAEGHDEEALLYSWLEELLIRFDTKGNLYSRFQVSKVEKTPSGLRLRAKIWGEPFSPERHPQGVGIKAVTYHRMEIVKKPGAVTLKFILDI